MEENKQILTNRCIAFNKYNKRCRAKTKNNEIFCCESHYPINKELIGNGCFMCYDKVRHSGELFYFSCKHAFHKKCYLEWLEFSTYDKPICLICRENVFEHNLKQQKKIRLNIITDITPLIKISDELSKSI